jgi:glycerate kinase
MKVLLAPDSYKGCLTSKEVCAAMSEGLKKRSENIEVVQFPSSDGGEGFCDCMRNIFGGEVIEREVTYPLGNKGKASFLYLSETKTAYIEMASASGLMLVPKEKRNVLRSSTKGTGELIKEAIKLGAKTVVLGLGGSATNDCGIGLLHSLGMRFLDSAGFELKPIAASLNKVQYVLKNDFVDISGVKFIAACDVKNPLCGENGAANVFARQKGASDHEVELLDKAAAHFAMKLNIDPELPGAGAAGGVGAAVLSVLNGEYVSGASLLVNSEKFKNALSQADLLITGEGNTDSQTAYGKLVSVVATAAKSSGVKTVVLSGGLSEGYETLRDFGVTAFRSLIDKNGDLDYCLSHAKELIAEIVYEII